MGPFLCKKKREMNFGPFLLRKSGGEFLYPFVCYSFIILAVFFNRILGLFCNN